MNRIQTVVSFEAAHRLYGVDTYSAECRESVHGHSYKATVVAGRTNNNEANMVMDFKLFKKIVREEVEDKYDHSIILRDIDPLVPAFKELAPEQKLNVVADSPTAEWMAASFFSSIESALQKVDPEVRLVSVAVQETENNIATYIKEA